jgi:hypothetical protein
MPLLLDVAPAVALIPGDELGGGAALPPTPVTLGLLPETGVGVGFGVVAPPEIPAVVVGAPVDV